jgi:hypothetical protein
MSVLEVYLKLLSHTLPAFQPYSAVRPRDARGIIRFQNKIRFLVLLWSGSLALAKVSSSGTRVILLFPHRRHAATDTARGCFLKNMRQNRLSMYSYVYCM